MLSANDRKIATLLLQEGHLTKEQLDECLGIQRRLEQSRSLASIIVARRYMSADRLKEIMSEAIAKVQSRELVAVGAAGAGPSMAGRAPASALPPPLMSSPPQLPPVASPGSEFGQNWETDLELARMLVVRGIVTEGQARECLALLQRVLESKSNARLTQVILKRRYATRDSLRDILKEFEGFQAQKGLRPGEGLLSPALDTGASGSFEGSGSFEAFRQPQPGPLPPPLPPPLPGFETREPGRDPFASVKPDRPKAPSTFASAESPLRFGSGADFQAAPPFGTGPSGSDNDITVAGAGFAGLRGGAGAAAFGCPSGPSPSAAFNDPFSSGPSAAFSGPSGGFGNGSSNGQDGFGNPAPFGGASGPNAIAAPMGSNPGLGFGPSPTSSPLGQDPSSSGGFQFAELPRNPSGPMPIVAPIASNFSGGFVTPASGPFASNTGPFSSGAGPVPGGMNAPMPGNPSAPPDRLADGFKTLNLADHEPGPAAGFASQGFANQSQGFANQSQGFANQSQGFAAASSPFASGPGFAAPPPSPMSGGFDMGPMASGPMATNPQASAFSSGPMPMPQSAPAGFRTLDLAGGNPDSERTISPSAAPRPLGISAPSSSQPSGSLNRSTRAQQSSEPSTSRNRTGRASVGGAKAAERRSRVGPAADDAPARKGIPTEILVIAGGLAVASLVGFAVWSYIAKAQEITRLERLVRDSLPKQPSLDELRAHLDACEKLLTYRTELEDPETARERVSTRTKIESAEKRLRAQELIAKARQSQEPAETVNLCEEATKEDSSYSDGFLALGEARIQAAEAQRRQGKIDEFRRLMQTALAALSESLRLDGGNAMAAFLKAEITRRTSDVNEGKADILLQTSYTTAVRNAKDSALGPLAQGRLFEIGIGPEQPTRAEQAIRSYSQALEKDQSNRLALLARAELLRRAHKLDAANKDLVRLLDADPKDADALFLRAHVRIEANDFAGAKDDIAKGFEVDRGNAYGFAVRAMLTYSQAYKDGFVDAKVRKEALRDCDEAIKTDPFLYLGYRVRAEVRSEDGSDGQRSAKDDMLRAVELGRAIADNHYWLGKTMQVLDENERSLTYYNNCIKLDATNVNAFNNRGGLWRKRKEFGKALDDLNMAVRLDPRNAVAIFNRVRARWEEFQLKTPAVPWTDPRWETEVISDLNSAIRENPKYAEAYGRLAYLLERRGKLAEAETNYGKAIENSTEPGSKLYWVGVRGLFFHTQKRWSDANEDFQVFSREEKNIDSNADLAEIKRRIQKPMEEVRQNLEKGG